MSFVKFDETSLDSSVWCSIESIALWATCLLMARPAVFQKPRAVIKLDSTEPAGWEIPPGTYGLIEAASSAVLKRACVRPEQLDAAATAWRSFFAPDPESKTPDFEGRRLARVDGGFVVINFQKYRDKDHSNADRQRRHREKQDLISDLAGNVTVTASNGSIGIGIGIGRGKEKKKKKECTFQEFIADCKARNEKPLPPDDPVFAYATKIKLPIEFLRICWREFADRSSSGDPPKEYKGARGWRQAFGNCVRSNWYHLWFRDERADWALTTAGHQANRAHTEKRPEPGAQTAGAHT